MVSQQSQSRREYPFAEIEPAWQARWEETGMFEADPVGDKPNWVVIELPPFANGSLHLGHVRNYAMGDVSARFRRMAGYNVLYTSGFDSFGLPNEISAREADRHPKDLAEEVMQEMRKQFIRLGLSHDTRRIIGYHEEQYYKWVQWVFIQLFEQGTAYRQQTLVNWCGTCELTLADSLAEGGKCWRCGDEVEIRSMEQWLIEETAFADEMLASLDNLKGWPAKIKQIHKDWIGRRTGVVARFTLVDWPAIKIDAFTNNPVLLPAAGYLAVSPDHPIIADLRGEGILKEDVLESIRLLYKSGQSQREQVLSGLKTDAVAAVDLDIQVQNPLNGDAIPLVTLGSLDLRTNEGVLVGFPAHLRADHKLAARLKIEGKRILSPPSGSDENLSALDWHNDWVVTGTGTWDGLTADKAASEVIAALQRSDAGEPAVRYRLRDWNIARQRYWGPPVPIIHCGDCGTVAVPEHELPVVLPYDINLKAQGNPLDEHAAFVKTACPKCGKQARRDSDTLEAYSSPWWYHWNCKRMTTQDPFNKSEARMWWPVDLMIGGEDQARTCFFHVRMMARALRRKGIVEYDEPIETLLAIGMVKNSGRKMSKSEGNVVDPSAIIARYGADALRLGILSAASPESVLNWSDAQVKQSAAFLTRVWQFCTRLSDQIRLDGLPNAAEIARDYSLSRKLARQLDTAIRRTTQAFCQNLFHLAASNLAFLLERIEEYESEAVRRRGSMDVRDHQAVTIALSAFLRMLNPLCPHIAEELWARCGGDGLIAQSQWPARIIGTEFDHSGRPDFRPSEAGQMGRRA